MEGAALILKDGKLRVQLAWIHSNVTLGKRRLDWMLVEIPQTKLATLVTEVLLVHQVTGFSS
jgi:hypothetical protein